MNTFKIEVSLAELGKDFTKFVESQNDIYQLEVKAYALYHMQRAPILLSMISDVVERERFIEDLCRNLDKQFRNCKNYKSWSKWWHETSSFYGECVNDNEWDGDENLGYCYTIAQYDKDEYWWHIKP